MAVRDSATRILRRWATSAHPLEWVCLVAGAVLLVRYRWILDDAFVYFRYVDNLLFLKLGLVYNPGEYVEGYTSPAWVLVLSALRFTELPYRTIVLLVGLATLFAVWCILVALNRELAPPGATFNFPMVFLLPNYAVLCYLTSGVDAPLVILAAAGYALFILRPDSRPLQWLVALSPLIRPELVIPYGLCVLWAWRALRRFPLRLALGGGAGLGAWLLFRVSYYADLFPNTFHLKNQPSPWQGLLYLYDTMSAYHGYEVFALLAALALLLSRKGGSPRWSRRGMMLAAAAPVLLYVIAIGGDARHFRYLAFPFCLISCALGGIPERAWSRFGWPSPKLLLPAAGLVFALVTFTCYPRQLDRHPLRSGVVHTLVDGISDAELHRSGRITRRFSDWSERVTPRILKEYRASRPAASPWPVLAGRICVENYIHFDTRIVQNYGLTDAILARVDVAAQRPGHKRALLAMGAQLARIEREAGAVGPGMLERAVRQGRAPDWIRDNLQAIELIERKVYNRHDFFENLRLAFRSPRITISSPPRLSRGAPRGLHAGTGARRGAGARDASRRRLR